jgi:hypothetical protein
VSALACTPPEVAAPPPACDALAEGHEELQILDPIGPLRSARTWAPWVTALPSTLSRGDLVACVDGEPVSDPEAMTRPGSSTREEAWQHLRTLDLTGLDPGEHTLRVVLRDQDGAHFVSTAPLDLQRGAHRIGLRIEDAFGAPTEARVVVTQDGDPYPLDVGAAPVDKHGRDHPSTAIFVPSEGDALWLDQGVYRLVAVRDVRDELAALDLVVSGPAEHTLVVRREVDDQRISADLHVHTGRSFDAVLPDRVRFGALQAAGVEVAVITDHNLVDGTLPAVDGVALVPGVEADVRDPTTVEGHNWDWAHLNAFPIAVGTALPPATQPTIGAVLDAYRARQALTPFPGGEEALLLQLNHPRGIQFRPDQAPQRGAWPMFNTLGFDPSLPIGVGINGWLIEEEPATGTTALHVDAMEILNRFSFELYLEVRDDWFSLLNQGLRLTGTGNSDSHGAWIELVGLPINLLEPEVLRADGTIEPVVFVDAVARGRVTVSTGPVLSLTVTASDGSEVGPGRTAQGAREAVVRVQAASWVPVPQVRLVIDGVVVELEELPARAEGEALDRTFRWPLALEADGWVLAEAGWPLDGELSPADLPGGDYALVAPGYVPLGFTNPVRVDVDGGGWRPPGL